MTFPSIELPDWAAKLLKKMLSGDVPSGDTEAIRAHQQYVAQLEAMGFLTPHGSGYMLADGVTVLAVAPASSNNPKTQEEK